MNILLTNDDGIRAVGLRALHAALVEAGHTVRVVAPMTEQSAVGHSLTIFMPLRAKLLREHDFEGLGVYGTPTDCVKLALSRIVSVLPDLVISGINAGANVGPDILYSGTVAAATEAAHSGCRAVAVSYDNFTPEDVMSQARHVVQLATNIPWDTLPPRCVVNVNYPHCPVAQAKGLRVCPQTNAVWEDSYIECHDPRGNTYWWLTGAIPPDRVEAGSDRALLTQGYITVTPLRFDFTDTTHITALAGLDFDTGCKNR